MESTMSNIEYKYRVCFIWKIENFSMCIQKFSECLYSPIFNAMSLIESKWKLRVYPKGAKTANYIAYFLQAVELSTENVDLFYSLECVGKDKNCLKDICTSYQFVKDRIEAFGFDDYLSHEEVYGEKENLPDDTLTFICCIKTRTRNRLKAKACTKIHVDQFSSLWKVNSPISPKWSEIKVFRIIEGFELKVMLSCTENDILIHMQPLNNFPFSTRLIKCKVHLIDRQGVERKSKTDSHLFDTKDEQWRFTNFITKGDIQDENKFLKNEFFVLSFEFSVSNGIMTETIDGVTEYKFPSVEYVHTISSESTLEGDFLDFTKKIYKKHFDFKIKIGELVVPCHKFVLAVRSPVFSAMFDHKTEENQNNMINIEDLDEDTLIHFLEYLYTNSLGNLDYDSTAKLLIAADKYQVLSLKEKCCALLMSYKSLENICETFVVADIISHKSLKDFVIDFVKHKAKENLNSSEWFQWMELSTKLGIEILREIRNQ